MSLTLFFETAVLGKTGHGSLYRVVTDPPSGDENPIPVDPWPVNERNGFCALPTKPLSTQCRYVY